MTLGGKNCKYVLQFAPAKDEKVFTFDIVIMCCPVSRFKIPKEEENLMNSSKRNDSSSLSDKVWHLLTDNLLDPLVSIWVTIFSKKNVRAFIIFWLNFFIVYKNYFDDKNTWWHAIFKNPFNIFFQFQFIFCCSSSFFIVEIFYRARATQPSKFNLGIP